MNRMNAKLTCILTLGALLLPLASSHAQGTPGAKNASLKQEIELSISRALQWFKTKQSPEGYWSIADEPAVSGLVLSSMMGDPTRKMDGPITAEADKGYKWLLSNVKPDGGIYGKGRANYNTSIALTALVLNNRPEYEQTILKARKFIIGQQNDFDEKGKTDNPFDGGIGYGTPKPNSPAHADLSNTHFAIEALRFSQKIFEDKAGPEDKKNDLNWDAAIKFIERCQNRPESNDQKWASADPKNAGGFVYEPGSSKAGEDKQPDGRVAMRSYGSISYAGMLSFIYAGLTPDDPRVLAAVKWLGENFTLDENPGMGQEGRLYYFHTMAKALTAAHLDELKTKDGKTVNWRDELARKLLNTQTSEGYWKNDTARWMEGDEVLATAYIVLALEHLHRAL
jgi:squalene-hopene/tetraprenyl-beta-curcumene cyclase